MLTELKTDTAGAMQTTMQEVCESPIISRESQTSEGKIVELSEQVVKSSGERTLAERRLLRKLDMTLMPTVVLIYIMNYIDRLAIASARLKGLEHDLGLSDTQYDTVMAILYTTYCTVQVPSNMILNRISRPSLYIGLCVIIWGLASALTGLTHNYSGIPICRVFIGLPEAAFYPGTIYLLSRWYTRKELTFRTSIVISGVMCSNAFGSLIAAGILSGMEGKRGIRGWRWKAVPHRGMHLIPSLYLTICDLSQGAITIAIGILSLWSLPDFPRNTRWMTHAERQLAQVRIAEDAGEADSDVAQESMLSGLKVAIKDGKILLFSLMMLSNDIGLSFSNFFPTLTSTLGFDTTISLLLAAPPWLLAAIICCLNGLHADKTGERFFHVCSTWWAVIAGFIIALSTSSIGGRYFSLFLMATGHASQAMILTWVSNTIPRPPAKRAVAIGLVSGIGNVGNLIGSYVWKSTWGPLYHQSIVISIAALALSSSLAFVMRCMLKHLNKQLDEDALGALKEANHERVGHAACLEGITLEQAMEKKRGFRYLY